jgi:hypothetical protein
VLGLISSGLTPENNPPVIIEVPFSIVGICLAGIVLIIFGLALYFFARLRRPNMTVRTPSEMNMYCMIAGFPVVRIAGATKRGKVIIKKNSATTTHNSEYHSRSLLRTDFLAATSAEAKHPIIEKILVSISKTRMMEKYVFGYTTITAPQIARKENPVLKVFGACKTKMRAAKAMLPRNPITRIRLS